MRSIQEILQFAFIFGIICCFLSNKQLQKKNERIEQIYAKEHGEILLSTKYIT